LPNLLFICSRNQWRSPTAELLFKGHSLHHASSAGTSPQARVRVNRKLLAWADIIFVMEQKHRDILRQDFSGILREKRVVVLDIEDNYKFNDPELIDILKTCLADYL
jgi:predicted protein tyrosine phosphatase